MFKKLTAVSLLVMLSSTSFLSFAQDQKSTHASGDDARQIIRLTTAERDAVLAEMRGFLQSTQQIVSALSAGDMNLASAGARKSGRGAGAGMPRTLHGKLPMGFKKLGRDTHSRFDQLALDAEQMGDGEHALGQLGELLGNCVACHATYRFEVE